MLLTAIIFIVLGILIKYGKMYFLIAGYNTLPKEEKKKYDIKGIASLFRSAMFGMALIIIIGYFVSKQVDNPAMESYFFIQQLELEYLTFFYFPIQKNIKQKKRMTAQDKIFMRRAISLAEEGMNANEGGPFGAIVVKDGEIIAEGNNGVTSTNDPTAHAEVVAIRRACEKLNTFQLNDCIIYTSCEPCPMCLGAIYWARPKKVFYACDKNDAAEIDFDDQFIYDEIDKPIAERNISFVKILQEEGKLVFDKWAEKENKTEY